MRPPKRTSIALLALLLSAPLLAETSPAQAGAAKAPSTTPRLPLGPANLPETRTVDQLAPGLNLTTITRGQADPAHEFWSIGVNLPVGEVLPDPDPDADQGSLATLDKAQAVKTQIAESPSVAAVLAAKGQDWQPRVEAVDWAPKMRDYRGGLAGYTLRVGKYATAPTAADPVFAALLAAHFKVFAVYTGQDGRPGNTGPWVVRVLTMDPRRFKGSVASTVGDAVSGQETTSAMAQKAGAIYATNGGFFSISPNDGTPGVPAGLSVVNGKVETAAVNGRVALILGRSGKGPRIEALSSHYTVSVGGSKHLLDALNRPAGVIRNCGGVGGDVPTQRPVQDFTCTDPDEVVAITPAYGIAPPAGAGVEALVSPSGRVTAVRARTGAAVPAGYTVLQAIGADATWLSKHARIGARVCLTTTVKDDRNRTVRFGSGDSVVNGGPLLVRNGRVDVDINAEGMVHENPALGLPTSALGAAFGYNWFIRDNPRTGAGIDAAGRLLLVQVDGRQDTLSQGLSIQAFAEVMRSLGSVQAINLDGGGSSATVINGRLVSSPSDVDSTGTHTERKDGDAIVVVPSSR